MHLLIITCLLYKEKDKCFVALFIGGAGGKPAFRSKAIPSESACTYDVSRGAATANLAAELCRMRFATAKRIAPDREQK